jgi:glycosyltransferase involved in cell wall biosynthesis
MKLLFVHQNFPGQYLHLARHMAAQPGHEVVCITQRKGMNLPGVRKVLYAPRRKGTPGIHHYLVGTESHLLNAQEVARCAMQLKREGFTPDVMIGHNGWGEIWFLKDVFQQAPLLGYFEFFYKLAGADMGFDPADVATVDSGPRIRTRNLGNLLGLDAVDAGQCPTQWQRSVYPAHAQPKLRVLHDGIDTNAARPDANATLDLPMLDAQGRPVPGATLQVKAGDEIVTYVARNLEPYRGFPTFMRSLPRLLSARPKARVVIVGGDDVSYGRPLPPGQSHRQLLMDELGDGFDRSRVHFLGRVPYANFLRLLQVSAAHVYLTYPFVLSWSMMEAMAAGCLVIGSDTPPVREMITHERNGLLVDFFSPEHLAEAVIKALADRAETVCMRLAARRFVVDRFDLESVCLPAQRAWVEQLAGVT